MEEPVKDWWIVDDDGKCYENDEHDRDVQGSLVWLEGKERDYAHEHAGLDDV